MRNLKSTVFVAALVFSATTTGVRATDVPTPSSVVIAAGSVVCPAGDPLSELGSCNQEFRDRTSLAGITNVALIETVHNNCAFAPNGPYNHHQGNAGGTAGAPDSPIDYVVYDVGNVTSNLGPVNASIGWFDSQLDTDLAAEISGGVNLNFTLTNPNTAPVTVTVSEDPLNPASQIVDLPGFDFILFEKNGGGGTNLATLVCDTNMWFRTAADGSGGTAPLYGLNGYVVNHKITRIRVGWYGGPSGLFSQDNAEHVCDVHAAARQTAGDLDLEKEVSYIVMGHKVTAANMSNPVSVTGCGPDDNDPAEPRLAGYCDQSEQKTIAYSRPNACNPNAEIGGSVPTTATAIVDGANSCIQYFRGTPIDMCSGL